MNKQAEVQHEGNEIKIIGNLDMHNLDRSLDTKYYRDNNITVCIQPKEEYPYYININDVRVYFERADFWSDNTIILFSNGFMVGAINKAGYGKRIFNMIFRRD